jgi:DNA-directed DNA polymerase III PolC
MFLCHTYFSFKYGTLSPHRLFDEAKRCGVKKLALTEINNTASYIEMLRVCAERKDEHELEITVGVECRVGDELLFIALPNDNRGFEEVNRFLSAQNASGDKLPLRAPMFLATQVIYPMSNQPQGLLKQHEWIGVRISETRKLIHPSPIHPIARHVILHPVTFATKTDFNIHRLLRAIDHNALLSKLAPHQQALPEEVMVSEEKLEEVFQQFPEVISNTKKLIEECSVMFELGSDKNKKTITGSSIQDFDMLSSLSREGLTRRYTLTDPIIEERFLRELEIIRQKNFVSYYLIANDIVKFADSQGFEHVGRGSGANSMIAYCLGITDVDPLELDLYFERFLNPERTSPPDFDLDFSWKDRDAVYDYIFQRYGKDHTCLLGTHVTYQGRSILRELAKVFGLPKNEIDEIVDDPKRNRNRDHITKLVFDYAEKMVEMPAMMSVHAGGVLITENPIYQYTATALPPKGYPVSHFEMHNAEDLGIYKFDILSQRGLGHIKETVRVVKENKNEEVDIHRFSDFKRDKRVRDLLRTSKAIGCFYVESPAMRMLLGKLRCEDYITLVAASSIIRPGVARSGMMRAYIERFHLTQQGKKFESIHPKMDELMAETYGVMVYQEDVIKVAHHFAGLTLAEADVLRRGMSGKFRSRKEFERIKETFFNNCKQRQYPQHVTERVWFEIESFSGYSFSKGHSASYAVESYQSLFLKAYHPLEFMVGVINNFGGFYKTEFYFQEARMAGAIIEAPCVNRGDYMTSITDQTIFVGFIHLKSLETKIAQSIAVERKRRGNYRSLHDFVRRVSLGLEQTRILIRVGAFRFTGKTKQRLMWEAMLYYSEMGATRQPQTETLFDTEPVEFPLPVLYRHELEDMFDEIELIGFPLNDPFRLLASSRVGDTMAGELLAKNKKPVHLVGYLVTTKATSTKDGKPMHFGTFLDSAGEVFDTTHFPEVSARYPFRGRGFYSIKGKAVEDFGVPMIEVSSMEKLPLINLKGGSPAFLEENRSLPTHNR